jgi:hypothetical protein
VKKIHAQIIFVLSFFLLSLVILSYSKLSQRKFVATNQPKTNLTEAVNKIGDVLTGCGSCWDFFLKDSSTGNYILDATAELTSRDDFEECFEGNNITPTWFFGRSNFLRQNSYDLNAT